MDGPLTVAAATYYLSLFLTFGPRVPAKTFHAYFRALDTPILYPRFAGQTIIKNGVRHVDTHVVIEPLEGWVSITAEDEQDPYNSAGYSPAPFDLYMRSSGHRALVACPALMGGITKDDNIGVIAGLNRWLP